MTKKELMIKAHKMTKEIKKEYAEVDYKFQLGLCLSYLYKNEGEVEMINYTTKNGAKVEIRLEGRIISDLTVNGIEVVKDNADSNNVFISTLNNTVVINSRNLYKKLGSSSVIRIEANEEVISLFNEAVKKQIEKENKELERQCELTKKNLKENNISDEQFMLTFNKHMNNKNNF